MYICLMIYMMTSIVIEMDGEIKLKIIPTLGTNLLTMDDQSPAQYPDLMLRSYGSKTPIVQ